jgi:hypothetical protein
MANRVLYANAIDFVRTINDNLIDNALGARTSYAAMPSLYQRAYILCHETGELPVTGDILAPDESLSTQRTSNINIITGTR